MNDLIVFDDENSPCLTFGAGLTGQRPGLVEIIHDGIRMVVRRDAVDRQGPALDALMDEHQLASGSKPVPVPALFHGQPDGLHLPLARGQTIARYEQVEMERPQTIRTVIAVIDARDDVRRGDDVAAMCAPEITEGGS